MNLHGISIPATVLQADITPHQALVYGAVTALEEAGYTPTISRVATVARVGQSTVKKAWQRLQDLNLLDGTQPTAIALDTYSATDELPGSDEPMAYYSSDPLAGLVTLPPTAVSELDDAELALAVRTLALVQGGVTETQDIAVALHTPEQRVQRIAWRLHGLGVISYTPAPGEETPTVGEVN